MSRFDFTDHEMRGVRPVGRCVLEWFSPSSEVRISVEVL